jgi:hypothetical protein
VPRHKLALEAVALRQQLAVFKRKQPRPVHTLVRAARLRLAADDVQLRCPRL